MAAVGAAPGEDGYAGLSAAALALLLKARGVVYDRRDVVACLAGEGSGDAGGFPKRHRCDGDA